MLGENLMRGHGFGKRDKTTLDIIQCVSESSTAEGCLEEVTLLMKSEITFFRTAVLNPYIHVQAIL